MHSYLTGLARLLLLIVFCLPLFAAAQEAPVAGAVWVGETGGIVKVASADGTVLLQLDTRRQVDALAIDAERRRLWVYGQDELSAFDFSGTQLWTTPVCFEEAKGQDNGGNARPPADGAETRCSGNAEDAALAVDSAGNSLWLARGKTLVRVASDGSAQTRFGLAEEARAIAIDAERGLVWVASKSRLLALGREGDTRFTIDVDASTQYLDVAFDQAADALWAVARRGIQRFDADGRLLATVPLDGPLYVAPDGHGSAWVATAKRIYSIDASGRTQLELLPFSGQAKIVDLVADGADGSAWAATQKQLVHVGADAATRHSLDFRQSQNRVGVIRALALYTDAVPPRIAFLVPEPGSYLNKPAPEFRVDYSDQGFGVDTESLYFEIDGAAWPFVCAPEREGADCTPADPLPQGLITVAAQVADLAGNLSDWADVTFTIDTEAPAITLDSPEDGGWTASPDLTISGSLDEPVELTIAGEPVALDVQNRFEHTRTLVEGENGIALSAVDWAGNRTDVSVNVWLDTVAPAAVPVAAVAVALYGVEALVQGAPGSAEPGARVVVTNTRTGETATAVVAADGSFSVRLPALPGDALTIRVADAVDNTSDSVAVAVPGEEPETGYVPPEPADLAPPLDPTVPTTVHAATTFLYTGRDAVQQEVDATSIEPHRAAVLRGSVRTRGGAALPGVRISVVGHDEYGWTGTRTDGLFDLVVNGGAWLTVRYEKAGYLPVQRQIKPRWNDYDWLPDVVMIRLDPRVTRIDLASDLPIQTARGSVSSDEDGVRRATLLFPGGTRAELVMPDGSSRPLTALDVRATEYTVGPNGPDAMPGELPPTSGYTYAVELSVDEAISEGAREVRFDRPVPFYLENFLGFPIGGAVPAGWYDREKAAWISSANGRIVEVVSITNGMADLDVDGSGAAAGSARLATLGISDAERRELAALYVPGQTLWRVPVEHFTPWDFNWPYGPPLGATGPNIPVPVPDPSVTDPSCVTSSIIECQNQTLGELLPIVGASYGLHYRSDRVRGRVARFGLEIPLTGESVLAELRRIDLRIQVAGHVIRESFDPAPDLSYTFQWDGRDVYGRPVEGTAAATVEIGYVYPAVYYEPAEFERSFALAGQSTVIGDRQAGEVTMRSTTLRTLGDVPHAGGDLGTWTVGVHHYYDANGTLFRGDGARVTPQGHGLGWLIDTFAGTGVRGNDGDGGPARQAEFQSPAAVAFGPSGELYVADVYSVRRIDPNGTVATIAGGETSGFAGDGGEATAALFRWIEDIAVGHDGSVYIADTWNHRIRRVGPDGIVSTIAGNGVAGFAGDGGVATAAQLNIPMGVAVGRDGSVYVADGYNRRVRKVGPDGIIQTIAGTGSAGYGVEASGGPAVSADLYFPNKLAVGEDGSVFVADPIGIIWRVRPDGTIWAVAGSPDAYWEDDGRLATETWLPDIRGVAVGGDGSIYFATAFWRHQVKRVTPDGILTTVAGGASGYAGDGGPGTRAQLNAPWDVAIGPDGSLYVADMSNFVVRRLSLAVKGGATSADSLITSEDGQEYFLFDADGRHFLTGDALTGSPLRYFHYDDAGRLRAIEEVEGGTLTIERDSSGQPLAIVAPDGQRTALEIDPGGSLVEVTNPAGESYRMEYTADQLLTRFTDPRGNASTFTYDEDGRLIADRNVLGGGWTLSRTEAEQGYGVTLTSGEGRVRRHTVEEFATGASRRTDTHADGTRTITQIGTGGERTVTEPDGTVTTTIEGPDPRFGMDAPVIEEFSVTTPGGKAFTASEQRSVVLADSSDLFALSESTDVFRVNGRTSTYRYTAADRQGLATSPAGRTSETRFDALGRITGQQDAGLDPLALAYDGRGRLAQLTLGAAGERHFSLAYDAEGNLARITDPLLREYAYEYDAAGRSTREVLPDGRAIAYTYDAAGNLTSLTPPGRSAHVFAYTPVNLQERYIPPALDGVDTITRYTYDLDKNLTSVVRPDGQTVRLSYDAGGRLTTLDYSWGRLGYAYHSQTGQLAAITTPEGDTLSFTWDGFLPVGESWSGEIAGSVAREYDNNFWPTGLNVDGQSFGFAYDDDGLLTAAGDLALTRDPAHGLVTGTAIGVVTTAHAYNGFGEPAQSSTALDGTVLIETAYTRDLLGRITEKRESVDGNTTVYSYSYDPAGRLSQVQANGTTTASYTYDANGNRLNRTSPTRSETGTYDAQDRVLTYAGASYTYTANGELASKAENGAVTGYDYDELGNLRQVTLPGDVTVDYLIDGRNRRIGKKVNGTLVQGLLYQDQLNPVAELDGSGNVVARFVYAEKTNVPAYMLKDGKTYRIVSDHLGSPRRVVDTSTGEVVQRLEYDEFGRVLEDSNPGFQPFGFAGGIYDQHTGLVRFGARDYDPVAGRWTAKDPIRFDGGSTGLYTYVLLDPVNLTDPEGKLVPLLPALYKAFVLYGSYQLGYATGSLANSTINMVHSANSARNLRKRLDRDMASFYDYGRSTDLNASESAYKDSLLRFLNDTGQTVYDSADLINGQLGSLPKVPPRACP